jgi:hypothetical protein
MVDVVQIVSRSTAQDERLSAPHKAQQRSEFREQIIRALLGALCVVGIVFCVVIALCMFAGVCAWVGARALGSILRWREGKFLGP